MIHADSTRSLVVDLRDDAGRGALFRVAGLSVLLRNLLLFQRRGFRCALLLCEDQRRRQVLDELRRCPRVTIATIVGPDVDLREAAAESDGLLYWPGALTYGRFLPGFVDAGVEQDSVLELATGAGCDGPLLAGAVALAQAPTGPSRDQLAWLKTRARTVAPEPGKEALNVLAPSDARQAERALLHSLRKNADGAVAKYDRYISLAVSRWLMRLPIVPNHVTAAAGVLGVLCGLAAAQGGYWWMLAGAVGFQLNSIFDGIDGEIARAKLLESRAGQWLDTISDDFTNFSFVVGVGVGCFRTYGWPGYLVLGIVAGLGQIVTSSLQYHYLVTVAGTGDLNDFKLPWEEHSAAQRPAEQRRGVLARVDWILRRDAFVAFSTLAAILGQLRWMTWAYALGATAVWSSILAYRALRLVSNGRERGIGS